MNVGKPNIILLGAGGHCVSVIDVIELQNKYAILGILDNKKTVGEKILGYPIIGRDNDIRNFINEHNYFLITVGQIKTPEIRIKLADLIETNGGKLATIISPSAYVSKYAEINEGTIIMHRCTVNAAAKIGKNCIVNTAANIEHGVEVGDFCHISTGAMINGDTVVGKQTFIGSNATLSHGIHVDPNSVIGAGQFIKK